MADKRIRLLVQAEVSKAVRNLNKLEKETDDTKQSASELTSTFKNLFGAAVLGAGARSIVQTASNFESLRTRLVALKGSTEEGAKAFNAFTKIAATTPFQVQNVVEAGATLEAFGVSSEESLKSIADLAAFMGTDIVDASAAFGRAFAGGAGAADILRERGILQLIKDAEGIEDLSKLTLPEFREALERAMTDPDGKIAGATDLLAQTFSGKVSNMQDAIDALQNAIGERMLGSLGDFAVEVGKAARETAEFVDNLSPQQIDSFQRVATVLGIMGSAYIAYTGAAVLARTATLNFVRAAKFLLIFEVIDVIVANMKLLQLEILKGQKLALESNLVPDFLAAGQDLDTINQKIADLQSQSLEFSWGTLGAIFGEDTDIVDSNPAVEAIDAVEQKLDSLGKKTIETNKKTGDSDKQTLKTKLENLAVEGQLDKSTALSSIKASANSATGAYIESIMQGVPFPANLVLAGLAQAAMGQLFEPLMKFQTGGSFVTRGKTTLPFGNGVVVGDNASGMERVDITPLPSPTSAGGNNITINISAPLVDETVVDHIIPAIRRAEKLNL